MRRRERHHTEVPMFSTQKMFRAALLAALPLLLAACGDAIEAVRQTRLESAPTRTVAEALEGYPYFSKVRWSSFEDKDGKTIVQAECDLDVAANCREVNPQSLAIATRDVARDYFVAQFVVAGWPRKVRPQWASHVTVCSSGTRLVFTDPKYLDVILTGERVRQFCLEGLNCAGGQVPTAPAAQAAPVTPGSAP